MTKPRSARVVTEPLGGSALAQALQAGRLPGDIGLPRPSSSSDWKARAEDVRRDTPKGWLDAIRPALAPTGAAAERLQRASGGAGIVVTTGQQAALFGGPLYTLAKALTARAIADVLEHQVGMPVAPVFWAATDDADFVEAHAAFVADADGMREIAMENRPPAGTPMSRAPLGDAETMLRELTRACGSAAHAHYLEIARAAFSREATLGDAYVRLMRALLEPLGIAILDSSHPAYLAAARPVLLDAASRADVIATATGERTAAVRAAGFEPQVEDDRGLSLVFAVDDGIKRRLTIEECRGHGENAHPSLAPNVLLRPVVERAILPTVAYVAGPGELAYFTQSNAVSDALGRPRLLALPRWSCTVIEPFAASALERLGVAYSELRNRHALEHRLATAALPQSVRDTWRRLEEQMRSGIGVLGDAVAREQLMPPAVIEGLGRSLDHRLRRAERRMLAAVKRRDERIHRDLRVAGDALFPGGERQERVLNFIPMLARGGDELIATMSAEAARHAALLVGEARPQPVAAR